ncbi:MAG: ribonuclease Y, partial [Armatimonadota bacterium]
MMDQLALLIVAVLGGAGIAGAAFYTVGRRSERREAEVQERSAAQQAERLLSQAQRDAEAGKAEALLSAKE